eukprot:TRINITY_DN6864_c0_g1_i3.p1 TRINITY_DN6864_c0_g1~~TRINITY_DN6864_c0_g1_i3.p1  ORF type:complete len:442 (+),score=52.65 TRINITY_DN6864_c0_g1_i3:1355-2680(+)
MSHRSVPVKDALKAVQLRRDYKKLKVITHHRSRLLWTSELIEEIRAGQYGSHVYTASLQLLRSFPEPKATMEIIHDMQQKGIRPERAALSTALNAMSVRRLHPKDFEIIWSWMVRAGVKPILDHYLAYARLLLKMGDYSKTLHMFEHLQKPRSWYATMIRGCPSVSQSVELFLEYERIGVLQHAHFHALLKPKTRETQSAVWNGDCGFNDERCKARNVATREHVVWVLEKMHEHGFVPNSLTMSCVVACYKESRDYKALRETLEVFGKVGCIMSVVHYTVIIRALAMVTQHRSDEASVLGRVWYQQASNEGHANDNLLCAAILQLYANGGDVQAVNEKLKQLKQSVIATHVLGEYLGKAKAAKTTRTNKYLDVDVSDYPPAVVCYPEWVDETLVKKEGLHVEGPSDSYELDHKNHVNTNDGEYLNDFCDVATAVAHARRYV